MMQEGTGRANFYNRPFNFIGTLKECREERQGMMAKNVKRCEVGRLRERERWWGNVFF